MVATNAVATIAAGKSFFIGNPLSRRFHLGSQAAAQAKSLKRELLERPRVLQE
jgi:hypothetical protein